MNSSTPDESSGTLDLPEILEKETESPIPVHYVSSPGRNDLVEFEGSDDPENPKNWPTSKKWAITASMGGMTFVVTFSSSVYVSSWQLDLVLITY